MAGYLGAKFNLVVIRNNPNAADFKIPELEGDAAILQAPPSSISAR